MIKDAYGNTRFYGIYRGVVVTVRDDGRVSLKVPQILADQVTGLAWPVEPTGSTPSIGDGVWIAFEGGDPAYPIWLGKFKADEQVDSANVSLVQSDWTEENSTKQSFIVNKPKSQPFPIVGGAAGTEPTFSGTPLFTGSYIAFGEMVHFEIQVDMDNITSFGSGQYYLDLPFASKYAYQFAAGCLHDISASRDYPIFGHVNAGEKRMYLKSIDAQGNIAYNVAFTSSVPVTLSTADNFHISGNYIADFGV